MTTTFEEELNRTGKLVYTASGVSMMPLIRQQTDLILIEKRDHWGVPDVVLFRRPGVTGRGAYVLHRIARVNPDGSCFIIGDNCISGETVQPENILGVLTDVIRDGKHLPISSPAYLHLYIPARRFLRRAKQKIKRILKKLR